MTSDLIEEAAALLRQARHPVALTGAGISTPSGIPDFRSPAAGLWERYSPEMVASLTGFKRDPEAFWAWLRPLLRRACTAEPNAAHRAVARLEQEGRLQALITQNIDGLHERAGSQKVLALHGQLSSGHCIRCRWPASADHWFDAMLAEPGVPRCSHCGGALKPDIVLFGEFLPQDVLRAAQREAEHCDLMLVAGSSLTVTPASLLPQWAVSRGAHLLIFNREPTPLDSEADVVIRMDIAEALPALTEACLEP
ncbi:MAG: SIR2 family NAD-dependent protein deacylase [Anaerolineae bacterium]